MRLPVAGFLAVTFSVCGPPKPPIPPSPPPTTTTTTTTTTLPVEPPPTPKPTPVPSTPCRAPQGVQWAGPGPVTTSMAPVVDRLMSEMTGCSIGSDCLHGLGPGESAAQEWMKRVTEALRAKGLCAGQHIEGQTDEIAVSTNCQSPWEGYHIANFGGGKVVWSPGSARPQWTPLSGCDGTPLPPPISSCGRVERWASYVKPHGVGSQLIDATAVACWFDSPIPSSMKNCGAHCCELSAEKGNGACSDEWYGVYSWTPGPGIFLVPQPGSTATQKVAQGQGIATVCGSKDQLSCVTIIVQAVSPACLVLPNGHCEEVH